MDLDVLPGQKATLEVYPQEDDCPLAHSVELTIEGKSEGTKGSYWIARLPRNPEGSNLPDTHLKVTQRNKSETLTSFVNRFQSATPLSEPTGKDGNLDHFQQVLPEGACLLASPGETPQELSEKVFGLLRKKSPSIVGCSKGLHQDNFHFVTFNPGASDSNWIYQVSSEYWKLSSSTSSDIQLLGTFWADDLLTVLKSLQNPESKRLKFGQSESDSCPILPSTLAINGRFFFCDSLAFELLVSDDEIQTSKSKKKINLCIYLNAQNAPFRYVSDGSIETSQLILGAFEKWVDEVESCGLVLIRPVKQGDVQVSQHKTLAQWGMNTGENKDEHLIASFVVPGFVREKHSAWYTRLQPGDLVVVRVQNGSSPCVVGSFQSRRSRLEEESGPEVQVAGTQVALCTVEDDGNSAETYLNLSQSGVAMLKGKDKIQGVAEEAVLLETIVIKKEQSSFQGRVEVDGELDVG